jgi:signal transduction histidine kinase/DNA-binding response OmpR family regulator
MQQEHSKVRDIVDPIVRGEKVNILLVDDRVENLLALKAILKPLHQNIIEAHSGREALKCMLDHEFAAVLLDVMMPDMDGFETAELIREREKSRLTPIIFVTAMFLEEAHAFRGYSIGAVDYIMKPFVPEILRSKVSVFVDLFRKSEQVKRQAEMLRAIQQREYENSLAEAKRQIADENERVRTEQRIARAVVHHAPIGIVRLYSNLLIAEVNPVFCQQFHCDASAINGESVTFVLPWLPDSIVTSLRTGEPCRVNELKVSLPGDTSEPREKYWDFATWPIKDLLGNNVNTVLVSMDATERVQLDHQRKDFVGTLAHDLQTPVIASDRALELLISRTANQLEPDMIKLVSMLKRNNQNLLHMIQSLLDIYHYEMGAQVLYCDTVDVAALVTSCIEDLAPIAQEQNLSITSSFDTSDPKIWADRIGLRRVITNLLDNSIKHSPKGEVINVSVKREENEVVVEVADNGNGISKEDQPHLFERFWHGPHNKGYKSNSGLGLYLCRQITQAHGGKIECSSNPGKPTRFIVRLPVAQSKTRQSTSPATSDSSGTTSTKS